MTKILIIEDEPPISDLIKMSLDMAGYQTCQVMDGEQGLKLIKQERFDLVILDLMIPKIDGYELMPKILKRDIPIIVLTAKSRLEDKVFGLNRGADDYITKPFETIELVARVKAVLRRKGNEKKVIEFDDVKIIYDSRKVYKSSVEIELTLKEFELLKILVENKGIALSRESILQYVWGYEYIGSTRTVDIHIKNIRRKLNIDNIKTVYKVGYMFE